MKDTIRDISVLIFFIALLVMVLLLFYNRYKVMANFKSKGITENADISIDKFIYTSVPSDSVYKITKDSQHVILLHSKVEKITSDTVMLYVVINIELSSRNVYYMYKVYKGNSLEITTPSINSAVECYNNF